MASGYTNSHPRDEGSFYFETRFSWSSSYDPATNTSTVTFYPQIYTTVNMGNDLRMFDTKANNAGVYRDGSLIYAFSSSYSSGNFLRTWSNPYEDWCGLYANGDDFPSLTVTHDNSGAASINMGLRGGVISMTSGYPEAYSSWIGDGYYINLSESPSLYVSYYSNGGSGAPDDTYFYGSTESVVLSSTKPTRTGYTFLGWSESASATSATYSAGQNIGTRTTILRLYAVWRINSYTVTCEDRVGSSSGTKLGTKTASYNYGSSVSGASFGSNTSYDAYYTGYHYTGSSSSITVDGNETVYRYFALNTWTVSYNANGGSGAPSSQTKTYDVNLTLSSTKPTRTGYDFLGWSTSSTATSATYSAGGTYSANAAATLYAVWRLKTYTVSYNANGGSGAPASQTKTYGVDLTLSSTVPTRTGYDFLGWATSNTATAATYSAGGTYTANEEATLYAVWRLKTYAVSYNANGHGTAPSGQTKTYGTALTLRAFISNQTGTGTKVNYTITGNANGGTWSGSNGSASRTPKYTYTQNKWNTKSDGTGTGYASKASYTANAAATLYAIWNTSTSYTYTYALPTGTPTKNQTVTVTFNANGGSTTKASQTSTRAMTFSGWYTSASGGTKRTTDSQVSASETVYAHYGDGTSAYPSVTLPTASQCTRTGYTLLGFATSATATSAAYSPGESYTPTAGITLYAVWRIISYSVSANISARGITANILRTASPVAGAASGLLSDGDTVYYNDTVKVSWAISTGYQADTLRINGVDVSSLSEKTVTVASALTVILTVKLGAIVYINGVAYQAFIDNGSNFNTQYEAYIDNGSSWEAY